jgi:probable HAF family extracellular repeat protein
MNISFFLVYDRAELLGSVLSGVLMYKANLLLKTTFIFILVIPLTAVAKPKYTITDIGSLGEPGSLGTGSFGYGLNNYGQVTGSSIVKTGYSSDTWYSIIHAFVWNPKANKMIDLGSFGNFSVDSYAGGRGINNGGQVTGFADTATGRGHAFLWDTKFSQMIDLGKFDEASQNYVSVGYGINDNGQITGVLDNYDNEGFRSFSHAFVWYQKTGNMKDIGTLCKSDIPGCTSEGHGISSKGEVTGSSSTVDKYGGGGMPHAFFWNPVNAKMKDIGSLCGPKVPECFSEGYAINSKGQITGDSSYHENSELHAFLWSKDTGKMRDLGTLYGGRGISVGLGINAYGHIVGSSQFLDSEPSAFIWKRGTGMVDLNKLIPVASGWYLREATAINNRGQIVANGFHPILGTHALLLTPN